MTEKTDLLKFKIIIGLVAFIIFVIGLVWIGTMNSTFTVRFQMDNNTLEAMKLINYTKLG